MRYQRNPHPGFARRRPAEQPCLAASPTVTRQTPRVIIGLWPHISPVTSSHSILVIKRYNLRLYVVFSVLVTWRQLPRCGPSSPKRLEQQGRQFCEPTCKKKWGEAQCISLPSIRHPPKPNLLYCCLSRYQPFNNNTTTFTRRGLANCGLCFHYCLGQWTQEDWIGPGGSNQAAPSTAYQCANKRLVKYGAKNQTIQLPTSLTAQSLSIAKFLDSPSSSTSRRNPTTSSSLVTTQRRKGRSSQCQRLLSLKLN